MIRIFFLISFIFEINILFDFAQYLIDNSSSFFLFSITSKRLNSLFICMYFIHRRGICMKKGWASIQALTIFKKFFFLFHTWILLQVHDHINLIFGKFSNFKIVEWCGTWSLELSPEKGLSAVYGTIFEFNFLRIKLFWIFRASLVILRGNWL